MAHPDKAVCNCLFIVVCARSDKLGLVEVGGFQKVLSSDCLCDQEMDHWLTLLKWGLGWGETYGAVGSALGWMDVLQWLEPGSCLFRRELQKQYWGLE